MYGKRPPFAFQFGDDASELLPLIFQKQIDLPDESQMRLATACYDGLSPRGVELLGQQPIGSEDHTPASLPDQLDDERMTAVARSASDIEHRFDTHAGAFGTRVRLFSANHTPFLSADDPCTSGEAGIRRYDTKHIAGKATPARSRQPDPAAGGRIGVRRIFIIFSC